MTNPRSLRQRAQDGELTAIATLINHSFQKYQVQAEVQTDAIRLTVLLTGTADPAPQLAARVAQGILSLKLNEFSELVVMGFRQGTEAATWVKRFALAPTDGAELTSAEQDRPVSDPPNTESSPATIATQKSISSITKTTNTIDTESLRYQPPQQATSSTPSSSNSLPTSSAFSLSTKQLTIGLCLVGVITGGVLYKNWWRLLNAMGHTATYEELCIPEDSNGSQFYLTSGGALNQARLNCITGMGSYNPKAISVWLQRTANNPDQVDATGRTLLQMAIHENRHQNRTDLVRQALEHGADPNVGNASLIPLAQAARFSSSDSNHEIVQMLLDHGADVTHTWTTSDGQSDNALTFALWSNDLTIAQMLIDAGMEYTGSGAINLKGIGQSTDFTLLETLIDQGLDVNASEEALQISPPLFQAVELENMALARFLLSHGATISADQHQWLLARTNSPNKRNILALLSEYRTQVDSKD